MYTDSHMVIFGAYALFVLLAIGVVLVLWIFMPFSVFGLKGQIRKLAEEQKRTNELLETLVQRLGASPPASSAPPPQAAPPVPVIEPIEPLGVKPGEFSADEFDIAPGPAGPEKG